MTEKVWYRSKEGSWIEDRGKISVGEGGFRFDGRKAVITGVVEAAKKRPMGFQDWVHVTYQGGGESRDAYFLCSGLLGWSGALGGNEKLTAALRREIAPQP
jgi:hypothetical protein